jgi:uroporphyrinogen III methyltransferase/synthase
MNKGKVYLIGAGPGDPGLVTVKGLHCIQTADVVVYDYLAAPALLAHADREAQRIYVGKKGGDHTLSQDGINQLLVEQAGQGKTVARLKGGDPFIFGRGGEEVEVLIEAGIDFEVVPGVTSAVAAPAYAGIPLTHREYTSTLAFVTGHENPEKEDSRIDWKALTGIGTLVFFMGVKNLPRIAEKLLAQGMPTDKPVALVRWGTTSRQKTLTGTLGTIVEKADRAGMKAPAIIVIGDVVSLRDTMQWVEKRPLFGKRIVVTRAREQASALVDRLTVLGADCIECPTIRVVAEEDAAPIEQALANISAYRWLVFTSVNGVRFFFDRLFATGRDSRSLGHLKTACIGPATAAKLRQFGICSDIVPDSYRAESVVQAFSGEDVNGQRILLPRARDARPVLPQELARMGAVVEEIVTYRAEQSNAGASELLAELAAGGIDMITFTSSSTVTNFNAIVAEKNKQALLRNVVIAAIGPVTADTAEDLGYKVDVVADDFTIPGLCDAIRSYYSP